MSITPTEKTSTSTSIPNSRIENMSEEKKDSLKDQKEVAFYGSLVDGWVQTRMEKDKSILTLSSGAVAVLISLVSTVGVRDWREITLYISALFCFVITIIASLSVFQKNSSHLENVIKGETSPDPILSALDKIALFSFSVGVNDADATTNSLNGIGELRPDKGDSD